MVARTPCCEEHTLKADPFAQLTLLDVQRVDAALDQLAHRSRALPEQAALAALAERRTDVAARHGQAQTEVDDLGREQRKADADVEQVKARRQRNRERIDAGLVGDPKQLQAMQHEVESLDRRISDLEDEELAVMERLEDEQNRLEALAGELAKIEADSALQLRTRDDAASAISGHETELRAERELLVADLPADLLKLYDRLREQLGGIGAGALHQGRCEGCRLDVGAADLARMATAPSDEVLRCEQCNRILVRTPESGI